MERLQKVMSNCGVASRRASEQMILDGRVRVNGVVIRELGTKVDPDKDIIAVDGKRLELQPKHYYFIQ
jgi:23S rRNA pseudouridine2605 synthase